MQVTLVTGQIQPEFKRLQKQHHCQALHVVTAKQCDPASL